MRLLQRYDHGSPRGGGAVMELALVAPLLVGLIFGTLEVSRALHVKQILSDTVRGAGRLAIQPETDIAEVNACAQKILKYNNIHPGTVTVTVNGQKVTNLSTAKEGDEIGVTVALKASSVSYVLPHFLPADSLLRSTIVLRRQKSY